MGYIVIIGGDQHVPIASNGGWASVRNWVESLDAQRFPEVVQFVEHGLSQNLPAFEAQLRTAMQACPPHDAATASTIQGLYQTLTIRHPGAASAILSDGTTEGMDDPADQWSSEGPEPGGVIAVQRRNFKRFLNQLDKKKE